MICGGLGQTACGPSISRDRKEHSGKPGPGGGRLVPPGRSMAHLSDTVPSPHGRIPGSMSSTRSGAGDRVGCALLRLPVVLPLTRCGEWAVPILMSIQVYSAQLSALQPAHRKAGHVASPNTDSLWMAPSPTCGSQSTSQGPLWSTLYTRGFQSPWGPQGAVPGPPFEPDSALGHNGCSVGLFPHLQSWLVKDTKSKPRYHRIWPLPCCNHLPWTNRTSSVTNR